MDGIFIPKEILQMKGISMTEKAVLSIYKYYTEQGTNKCCSLNKTQIANELNISVEYMKDIKKHLIDLGYIRTDGGIKVIYLGVGGGQNTHQVGGITPTQKTEVGDITPTGGGQDTQGWGLEHPLVGDITPSKWGLEHPHKEEKKEKNIKKEEKRDVSNFDIILGRLPDDYKTQEKIDYMKEYFLDKINQQDFTVGGTIDMCVVQLKAALIKKFPIEYKVTESLPKQRSNTIDVF